MCLLLEVVLGQLASQLVHGHAQPLRLVLLLQRLLLPLRERDGASRESRQQRSTVRIAAAARIWSGSSGSGSSVALSEMRDGWNSLGRGPSMTVAESSAVRV